MSDVVIDVDVLTSDAQEVWQDASTKVVAAKDARPSIGLAAWALPFDPVAISSAYSQAYTALGEYLDGGSREFLLFEKKLLEAVIAYGEAHGLSAAEIEALRAEIDV